jgi:hypothetical protein
MPLDFSELKKSLNVREIVVGMTAMVLFVVSAG